MNKKQEKIWLENREQERINKEKEDNTLKRVCPKCQIYVNCEAVKNLNDKFAMFKCPSCSTEFRCKKKKVWLG